MLNSQSTLETALLYASLGFRTFPIWPYADSSRTICSCRKGAACDRAGKHPIWTGWPERATADKEKVRQAFGDARITNLGIATGQRSNLLVIDIDDQEAYDFYSQITPIENSTLTARTGNGWHLYYQYTDQVKQGERIFGGGIKIDSRADGGFVVAPPSFHAKAQTAYHWLTSDTPPALIPSEVIARLASGRAPKPDRQDQPAQSPPKKKKSYEEELRKFTLDDAKDALKHVSAEDRSDWRNIGIALGRHFNRSDEAWGLYLEWADNYSGQRDSSREKVMKEAFYTKSKEENEGHITVGTIIYHAQKGGWIRGKAELEKYCFHAEEDKFMYSGNNDYVKESVLNSLPNIRPVFVNDNVIKASSYIKRHRTVRSVGFSPIHPHGFLEGKHFDESGFVVNSDLNCYNKRKTPYVKHGRADEAKRYTDYVEKVYGIDEAAVFLKFMAHLIQKPHIKPSWLPVIGGDQGIGKDVIVELAAYSLFGEDSEGNLIAPPQHSLSIIGKDFTDYLDGSPLVRFSETGVLRKEMVSKISEELKRIVTQRTLHTNNKSAKQGRAASHCGFVITTNHLAEGLVYEKGVRRFYVIKCASAEDLKITNTSEGEGDKIIQALWEWGANGEGKHHIAAYLRDLDISDFNVGLLPSRTEALMELEATHSRTADEEIVLEVLHKHLGNPRCIVQSLIRDVAVEEGFYKDKKQAQDAVKRAIPRLNYIPVKSYGVYGPHTDKILKIEKSDSRCRVRIGGLQTRVYAHKKVMDITTKDFDDLVALIKKRPDGKAEF